ncbi:MAG TPA: ATP-binding protein, partial [Blastocatellia bacterium]|nr:ATP-binding protein [Blastocatellia bacterium]
ASLNALEQVDYLFFCEFRFPHSEFSCRLVYRRTLISAVPLIGVQITSCLYGWGFIGDLGEPYEKNNRWYRDITVSQNFLQYQIKRVDEIRQVSIFANFDSIREEGTLTPFSEQQAERLRSFFPSNSNPPNPAAAREEATRLLVLRPVETEFIQGERLRFDETLFDEFKSITSGNVVRAVLNEVDDYVIGFLNIDDRQGEDHCRLFWGVNNDHTIVGIGVDKSQRDEIRRGIVGKLSRIIPPVAYSEYPIKFHQVLDRNRAPIEDLRVLELVIGKGEDHEFYCSESNRFYLKQEGVNLELKGQQIIAEVRRRTRNGRMR